MTQVYDEDYVRMVVERKDDALKHARGIIGKLSRNDVKSPTDEMVFSCLNGINESLELNVDNYKFKETRTMPELSVATNGSSGIEIRVKLKEKVDLVEFRLRDDVAQPVFISPWMQFEPPAFNEWRQQMAYEIVRRAIAHDELVKQTQDLFKRVKSWEDSYYRKCDQIKVTETMWREDRAKAGFPEDFSDIKVWPPEMMSDYGRQPEVSRADKLQKEVDDLKSLLKSTQEALEIATRPGRK